MPPASDFVGPPAPVYYVGWSQGRDGVWKCEAGTRDAGMIRCYERLIEAVELAGGRGLFNQLQVLEEGQKPQAQQTYRDRMMRPTR